MTPPEPTDPTTQDQNRDAIPAGHDSDSARAQEDELQPLWQEQQLQERIEKHRRLRHSKERLEEASQEPEPGIREWWNEAGQEWEPDQEDDLRPPWERFTPESMAEDELQQLQELLDEQEVDLDQPRQRPQGRFRFQVDEPQDFQHLGEWLTKDELQDLQQRQEQQREKRQQERERSQEALQEYREWWKKLQEQPQFRERLQEDGLQQCRKWVEQNELQHLPKLRDWWQQERERSQQQFPGYHVREPNGIWRWGHPEGHPAHEPNNTWGRGRRLGSEPGEPPPNYEPKKSTPEQLKKRREVAADAVKKQQESEHSDHTDDDQSQGHSR
jgi:hypothetical protein